MQEYVGVTEDRLHHILGVARKAYKIAKELGYDEDFCRKMFMIGWIHDIGYEFSKNQTDHPSVSFDLVCRLVCADNSYDIPISPSTIHAISRHGMYPSEGVRQ